jgi:hypothetical protein
MEEKPGTVKECLEILSKEARGRTCLYNCIGRYPTTFWYRSEMKEMILNPDLDFTLGPPIV